MHTTLQGRTRSHLIHVHVPLSAVLTVDGSWAGVLIVSQGSFYKLQYSNATHLMQCYYICVVGIFKQQAYS